jgi:hypothetical protein
MILLKMVEWFTYKLPVVVWLKHLAFVILLCLYEHLKLLKLLKTLPFGFQCIQPHLPKNIVNEGYNFFLPPIDVVLMGPDTS